jgi:peptidoglycan/LPS O-acetylase OafA/YrhL
MADRRCEALTKPAISWALRRAIRFAIATCVVALLLAAYLSGADAERFATTAYLAAFFAAVALGIEHFLVEADRPEQRSSSIPTFPTILGWAAGILVSVCVVAALVSNPFGAILAIVAGFALVLFAALARNGAFTP